MNYEELLKKYMAHVIDVEGVTSVYLCGYESVEFTQEEISCLKEIEESIELENK